MAVLPDCLSLVCPRAKSQLTSLAVYMPRPHVHRDIVGLVLLITANVVQHLDSLINYSLKCN